eukprot:2947-Chlamydomonas_euryale.AAC.1
MGSGQDTPGRAGRARTSARTKRQFAECTTKHTRKGEACGVVAARSLGAHSMCTMPGRGAAQSSRIRK